MTANSQLVIETVVVKDKKNDFVQGLTSRDFTVTEDGVPQTVSRIFEHQSLSTGGHAAAGLRRMRKQITIYKTLDRTQIMPQIPQHAQYNGVIACWCSISI